MKFSLANFKLNIFNTPHPLGAFPIGANGDYSAITNLTKRQMYSWPSKYFQLYMDYCLDKEIYDVAAMIRDVAFLRRIRLNVPQ
jgi:hypothetical protein